MMNSGYSTLGGHSLGGHWLECANGHRASVHASNIMINHRWYTIAHTHTKNKEKTNLCWAKFCQSHSLVVRAYGAGGWRWTHQSINQSINQITYSIQFALHRRWQTFVDLVEHFRLAKRLNLVRWETAKRYRSQFITIISTALLQTLKLFSFQKRAQFSFKTPK